MFDTLAAQIGAVFVVAICAFAFLKGDEPERVAAGAYILGWFACLLSQDQSEHYNIRVSIFAVIFAVDLIMLVVFGALVWKSRRVWPVWAAACQLIIVTSHMISLVDARPSLLAFLTVVNLAGYGVLISIAAGTFWAWQERRAAGLE